MQALLFAAAVAGALQRMPVLTRAPALRASPRPAVAMLADDDDGGDAPAPSSGDAAAKRLRAERLALQAERAALEAEQLELQAEQLKLETARRRGTPSDEAAPPAPPVDSAREPATAPVSTTQPSEPASQLLPNVTSVFNLDLDALKPNSSTAEMTMAVNEALAEVAKRMEAQQKEVGLDDALVERLRAEVFDLKSFYVTDVESTVVGTVFRGNLRADADAVYQRVQDALAKAPELAEKVQLLLLPDPTPITVEQLQEIDGERRPVFLALPAGRIDGLMQTTPEIGLALISLGIGCFTTLGYALSSFLLSADGTLIEQLQAGDPAPLFQAAPIALGLGLVQLAHEVGHYGAASRSGVKLGVPILLPSLQLGHFGCVTRLLSFPKDRTALFDVAAAGPAVGFVLSILLYTVGLVISPGTPAAVASSNPVIPGGLLTSSLLLNTLASIFLGDVSAIGPVVELHPLALIGFTSALLNALQLLPIGRLDGGRIATAVLGQGASLVSALSLFSLGFSTLFFGDNPVLLFFGLVVIFFQRQPDLPCANELSEVSMQRKLAAGALFTFMVLTLLPFPVPVANPQALVI